LNNFFIKEYQIIFHVLLEMVQLEGVYLRTIVIANFIGPKMFSITFAMLNKVVNLGKVTYFFDIERGFFYLKIDSISAIIVIITKIPFKT